MKKVKKVIRKVTKKVTKVKKVEYQPDIPGHNYVVFNKTQLETILKNLKESGAQQIGISLQIRKV